MNRLQFWVLTCSIIFIGPFFLVDIFLTRHVRQEEATYVQMERLAQEGNVYANRWQQLAVRVYQASQQDPALREILVRQHVNVTPKAPAAPPSGADTPAPAQSSKAGNSNRSQ